MSLCFLQTCIGLLLKCLQLLVAVLYLRELAGQLLFHTDKLVDGAGVIFLLQAVNLVEPFVDGIELGRVEVDAVHLTAHVVGHIFQFDITVFQAFCHLSHLREHFLDGAQR